MKKRTAIVIIATVVIYYLALLFYVGASQAASVTLAWDANTEPDLKGYIIYFSLAPGEYNADKTYIVADHPELWNPACGSVYDPFKTECCEVTIPNLAKGNNYFVATAIDEDKNESAYSEELMHFVKTIGNQVMKKPKDFEKIPETP